VPLPVAGALLAATALLVAGYLPTLAWLVDRWLAEGSYYAHGFLIPPIAAGWLYLRRDRLRAAPKRPAGWGIAVVLAGLLLHAASIRAEVHFTSAISLLPVIAGAVLFFFGVPTLRAALAPLAFLVFLIPLPLVLIAHLTLRLKLFAASVGVGILGLLGVPATQEGSQLHVGGETLMVGDACSGLRSLIALLALGFLVIQRIPAGAAWKASVYALVVPLAIAGNVVRVVVLCLFAYFAGAHRAGGLVHDATGLLIYGVTLLGLLVGCALAERALGLREVRA